MGWLTAVLRRCSFVFGGCSALRLTIFCAGAVLSAVFQKFVSSPPSAARWGFCKEATMLATATFTAAESLTEPAINPVPQVRVEYTNVEDFLVDYTSNETIGGMFIKTERPMAVGTQFNLKIQLPGGGRTIDASAEVRWTLPCDVAAPMKPGMGVRFETLSSIDKGIVENMLSSWR